MILICKLCLLKGKIFLILFLEQVNDARTVSIRNFNKNIMEDERVSISMVGT